MGAMVTGWLISMFITGVVIIGETVAVKLGWLENGDL
jgi:hypothetical protein